MLVADLYIRVSTEEQANKGYSLRYQEEALRNYCEVKGILIQKIIIEDFSAKSFKRPQWINWFNSVKLFKHPKASLLLFTKWDRFSRNTGDAYYMISVLNRIGIEPNAIEQPLDLTIPENRMILAFYLSFPEVENARRALNIKQVIRKAKEEGRWMGTPPIGYKNKITESGIKYIAPFEPQASLMRNAFELLAEGLYPISHVYVNLVENGLAWSRSAFYRAIRNVAYCGKVYIPGNDCEEPRFVDGMHEAIISAELFNKVQQLYSERNKKRVVRNVLNDNFPLRGFLVCPTCGRKLTASRSTGKLKNYYYYYHCVNKCKTRFRAELIHQAFNEELRKYHPKAEFRVLFRDVLKSVLEDRDQTRENRKQVFLEAIDELISKIHKGEELLLSGDISGPEYQQIKLDGEVRINIMGEKIAGIEKQSKILDKMSEKAAVGFQHLDELFTKLNTAGKREFMSYFIQTSLIYDEGFLPLTLTEPAHFIFDRNYAFT